MPPKWNADVDGVFDAAVYVSRLSDQQIWDELPIGTDRFPGVEGQDRWDVYEIVCIEAADDRIHVEPDEEGQQTGLTYGQQW